MSFLSYNNELLKFEEMYHNLKKTGEKEVEKSKKTSTRTAAARVRSTSIEEENILPYLRFQRTSS